MLEGGRLYVRTSRYRIEEFRAEKIIQSLVREAGMPLELAQKLAEEAENRLYKAQITYVTAPLIRELVNVLLLEMGYEEYRHRLTRLGLPVYDVTQLLENTALREGTVDEVLDYTAAHVFTEYLLLNQLPRNVADAHMNGDICISNAGLWGLKPDTIFLDFGAFEEASPPSRLAFPWVVEKVSSLDEAISRLAWVTSAASRDAGVELVVEGADDYLARFAKTSKEALAPKLAQGFERLHSALWGTRSAAVVTLNIGLGAPGRVAPALLEAYRRYVHATPSPRVRLAVRLEDGGAKGLNEKVSAISLAGGFVTLTSSPKAVTSYLGLKKSAGGHQSAPRLGVLNTLAMNLPRLAYEAEEDETYFRAKLALLTRLALEALDARRRHLRELVAKGLLPTLGPSSDGQLLPLVVNLVGLREACTIIAKGDASPQTLRGIEEKTLDAVAKVSREAVPGEEIDFAMLPDEAGQRLFAFDDERYGKKVPVQVREAKGYAQRYSLDPEGLRKKDVLDEVAWLSEKMGGGMAVALEVEENTEDNGVAALVEEAAQKLPCFTIRLSIHVCKNCGRKYVTPLARCSRCRSTQLFTYTTI